jgi:hypothetical protein
MSGVKNNTRVHADDKPFPGCLGRMVNLFDLTPSTVVNANKLLTDKPHRDHHGHLSFSDLQFFFFFTISFHFLQPNSLVCGFLLLGCSMFFGVMVHYRE